MEKKQVSQDIVKTVIKRSVNMRTINDREKIVIECNFAEASVIANALVQHDDQGKRMAYKMKNEQEIKNSPQQRAATN